MVKEKTVKIIVAGGSGFVGKSLVRDLSRRGHEVLTLSRRPGPGRLPWDGRGPGEWERALSGAGAVINLAGESIAQGRWSPERKRALRQSRLEATAALVGALGRAEPAPPLLMNASAVGCYGDRGGEELNEASAPGGDFLARLCAEWEAEASRAAAHGVLPVVLRLGVVLGPGGGALSRMLLPFRLGLGGKLGGGRQWMSWIAIDDLTGLIAHLLEHPPLPPASGAPAVFNAVSPNPVTNAEFSRVLAGTLHRPCLFPVPAFALKLALGEMAGVLLSSQKARPAAALASGYSFIYPELGPALEFILKGRT